MKKLNFNDLKLINGGDYFFKIDTNDNLICYAAMYSTDVLEEYKLPSKLAADLLNGALQDDDYFSLSDDISFKEYGVSSYELRKMVTAFNYALF